MQKQKDTGAATQYAWVILAVLYVGSVASYGLRASFGAYISQWEADFSASRTLITSISMVGFIVFAVAQPFVGKLNDHFGKSIVPSAGVFIFGISLLLTTQARQIWQVFVLYGIVSSLGIAACCSVITTAVISNWFMKKRGFALGLSASGSAVGQLILIPASLFIIRNLGWRPTMALLSIIMMVIVGPLFIFFLRSNPGEKGMKPYGYDESEDKSRNSVNEEKETGSIKPLPVMGVLKHRIFWFLAIPYFICGFTDVGLIQTHLIPMSEGKNFSESSIALAFSLISILNIAGTIVTGHLSDHYSRKRQLGIIFLVRAATFAFLITIRQQWLLIPFAVVYGAMEMATIAPVNSLTVQLFDKYSIGAVLGLVAVSHQLGGAVGSWVPGLLYDLTGSYVIVLMISIVLLLGASLISLRIPEAAKAN